jgi:hypothetical protein
VPKIGVALLSVLTAIVIAVAFSGTARADASNVVLYNQWPGKCADLPGFGADAAGTHLAIFTCASNPANDNQEWYSPDLPHGVEFEPWQKELPALHGYHLAPAQVNAVYLLFGR